MMGFTPFKNLQVTEEPPLIEIILSDSKVTQHQKSLVPES